MIYLYFQHLVDPSSLHAFSRTDKTRRLQEPSEWEPLLEHEAEMGAEVVEVAVAEEGGKVLETSSVNCQKLWGLDLLAIQAG